MYGFILEILLLSVLVVTTPRAQLTNIAGSTSVSVSPTDATCGRTSADSYCRVDLVADAGCVVRTCRTVCEDTGPTYTNLLRGVSGFNYDGSVTNTTNDFGNGDVTVAVFNRKARLAFLKRAVNVTTDFTLTFWIRPDNMETESSVIDIHGAGSRERVFNIRIGADLGLSIVSGTTNVTDKSWGIPRHAWSHIAVQFQQNRVKVFLNGSDESATSSALQLHDAADMSHLNLKIGQTFAADLTETHLVEEKLQIDQTFCRGRSDGSVKYKDSVYVRVYCRNGTVSSVDDDHQAFSCKTVTITDLPSSDVDFCQDKMNGWYSQPQSGYTQCRDGRRLNLHSCGGGYEKPYYPYPDQCNFCPFTCSCELDCPDGSANERCDALGFVCRDGERMAHPKYCDEYYFCVRGKYVSKKCVYPDRWSVEHGQCERFKSVSCGKRIPKNHPCEREDTVGYRGSPECILSHHPANCTGRKDGLYYRTYESSDTCGVFGCTNETLATLHGKDLHMFSDNRLQNHRDTYGVCIGQSRGINPSSGVCDPQGECPSATTGYLPDSPYFRCVENEVSTYRYDCSKYWRCQNGLWTVERCPERLVWSGTKKQCVSDTAQCGGRWLPETDDTKVRQFLGQLADIRLYDVVLSQSEMNELYSPVCSEWGRDAHPIEYVIDSDSSSFWLSRAHLDSVDILFDLRGMYKLEEISMTFFGPVPLVVSIFKKVTADDSWQLWRVFRDDCSDVTKCTEIGAIKLDDKRLTYNLLEASLGPLQRRASSLRVRLSGHRHEGAAQLKNISYYGLNNVALSRRMSRRCGTFGYVVHASSSSCLQCDCDVRGVTDGDVECNEIGGQCACKRYVTGRRCDRCLPGYDNIRHSDPHGCSNGLPETTAAFNHKTSPASDSLVETTTSINRHTSSTTSNPAAQGSSTPWLLYTTPLYIVVVVIMSSSSQSFV